jgi:hypothetical protein
MLIISFIFIITIIIIIIIHSCVCWPGVARQAAWESGRRRHLLDPAWLASLSYALAFAHQSPTDDHHDHDHDDDDDHDHDDDDDMMKYVNLCLLPCRRRGRAVGGGSCWSRPGWRVCRMRWPLPASPPPMMIMTMTMTMTMTIMIMI